jgi:hypothetical protein
LSQPKSDAELCAVTGRTLLPRLANHDLNIPGRDLENLRSAYYSLLK